MISYAYTEDMRESINEITERTSTNPELLRMFDEQRYYNGPMSPKVSTIENWREYERECVRCANSYISSGRFYSAISLLYGAALAATNTCIDNVRIDEDTKGRIALYGKKIEECKRKIYSQYPSSILERALFLLRRPETPAQLRI